MSKNRGLVELIRTASVPVSRTPMRLRDTPVTLRKERKVELEALLHLRDGFRALSGAVLVRPSVTVGQVYSIADWNQLTLWRLPFSSASEVLFFAEDILGRQFGLYKDEVVLFEPETGGFEHFAFALEVWAEKLVDDPDAFGQQRVKMWELDHPTLGHVDRLQPKRPRKFAPSEPDEWRVLPDLDLMRRYAELYKKTRAADDPTSIDLGFWWEDGNQDDP